MNSISKLNTAAHAMRDQRCSQCPRARWSASCASTWERRGRLDTAGWPHGRKPQLLFAQHIPLAAVVGDYGAVRLNAERAQLGDVRAQLFEHHRALRQADDNSVEDRQSRHTHRSVRAKEKFLAIPLQRWRQTDDHRAESLAQRI